MGGAYLDLRAVWTPCVYQGKWFSDIFVTKQSLPGIVIGRFGVGFGPRSLTAAPPLGSGFKRQICFGLFYR